jgi:hypothetical protein
VKKKIIYEKSAKVGTQIKCKGFTKDEIKQVISSLKRMLDSGAFEKEEKSA